MNDHLRNAVANGGDFSSDTTLLLADLGAKRCPPKYFKRAFYSWYAADGSDTRKSSHCAS